ncbi:MAG: Trk system potassium transporter TrkA [Muribaculaceae bacterium]|nr:Trk system potassium transporter TrkA [Muribaculaceae bacterium]
MKITIVGAGRVGKYLAKYFSSESQDVYLIDTDSEKLSVLESDFNMRTFVGSPTDFNILREAKADKADIFVAVTSSTSDNLVACALAKSMGARKTIARVDRYEFIDSSNSEVVRRMGVDNMVYPDFLAASTIMNSLEHPWCRSWNEFNNGAILLAAVRVDEDAPIVGHQLKKLAGDSEIFHISALRRHNSTIIPRGNDHIQPNDILYITLVKDGLDRVLFLTGKADYGIRRVVIMGGSKAAILVAGMARDKFAVTIVEKDIDKCRELAEACPECTIIYGDASEQDVMEESYLNKADAFVALSKNSESNIIACLTAKEAGVRKTIAEIEKKQFINKAESFRIGAIINQPIITANAIYQLILETDADSSRCFAMTHAEVARMRITDNSYLASAPIKELKVPHELTFAGLIRDKKGEIVSGATHLRAGDEVIIFSLKGSLSKVEKFFRK